jgi:hypothetical protein
MLNRRVLAFLILSAWVLALGWHARRELIPSAMDRLALGVRTLPPGVAYYAVYRGESRMGWAQTEIDTLPSASGFRIRQRLLVELPGFGPAGFERLGEQFLDAQLHLDSLSHISVVGSDTALIEVHALGDSALHVVADGAPAGEIVAVSGPVTTQAGLRLRLAASDRVNAGDRFRSSVFDPTTAADRTVELSVLEVGSLAYPDSADTDSISGAWIPVREDTVAAWRVELAVGAASLENWVDEDGRLVDGDIPGGYRVERTAFELAFFTRPGATTPGSPIPGDTAHTGGPE